MYTTGKMFTATNDRAFCRIRLYSETKGTCFDIFPFDDLVQMAAVCSLLHKHSHRFQGYLQDTEFLPLELVRFYADSFTPSHLASHNPARVFVRQLVQVRDLNLGWLELSCLSLSVFDCMGMKTLTLASLALFPEQQMNQLLAHSNTKLKTH